MRFVKIIFLASLLSLVNSCATLSREDCLQGAWFELGLREGRKGNTFARLAQHQKACSEYGIRINQAQYNTGRKQGLQDYCQLDNAIEMGLQGQLYQSVCPSNIHIIFLHYNQVAYDIYRCQEDLENLDDELLDKENSLLNNKLTDDDRSEIQGNIRDLGHERQRIRDDLDSRERRLEQLIKNGY